MDKSFIIIKKNNIQDDIKLIILFKSLLSEFDKQKIYILANQNIKLKKATTFLANNKV